MIRSKITVTCFENASGRFRLSLMQQQHDDRLWPTHSGSNYEFGSSSDPTPVSSSYGIIPSLRITVSDSDIMELEPADLMKNQHYRELHKRISDAAKALADATHMTSTLHQENSLLKVEVQSLKLNGMGQQYVHRLVPALRITYHGKFPSAIVSRDELLSGAVRFSQRVTLTNSESQHTSSKSPPTE